MNDILIYMNTPIQKILPDKFPPRLLEIPEPPKQLYIEGNLPNDTKYLCVVGSRKFSSYGKDACQTILTGLSGYPITIVSGLAIGIDSIAHRAALDVNLSTIAVPGSGLAKSALYPRANARLAQDIVAAGGALISEFEPEIHAAPWMFPKRNRIMAGIAHAVLIIEARERSGTLITARLAVDYNRDVFTIPASIFSDAGKGSNRLIRQGATPIISSANILEEFGFLNEDENHTTAPQQENQNCSPEENKLLSYLTEPTARDVLARTLNISIQETSMLISRLEIKGMVKEQAGYIRKI